MKIYYANADQAGCGFYRCYLPARILEERGHQVSVGFPGTPVSLVNDEQIAIFQRHYKPDVQMLVTQKKRAGIRIVFELDDDLWAIASDNPAYAVYNTGEVERRERNHNQNNPNNKVTLLRPLTMMKDFARIADGITVSTVPLAKRFRQWNKKVYVLPNGIVPAAQLEPLGEMHNIRIGWHGSMHHHEDLKPAAHALKRLMLENERITLVIMGWVHPMFRDKVFENRIEYYPWFPEPQMHVLRSAMVPLHIGLAPLEYNEFNLAKSNLKLLEYGAATVCPVAQDIFPYCTTIKNGVEGMLVKKHTEEHWYEAIKYAIDNPVHRMDMAKRLRDLVFENYTAHKTIVKYEEVYNRIIDSKQNPRSWKRMYFNDMSQPPINNMDLQATIGDGVDATEVKAG